MSTSTPEVRAAAAADLARIGSTLLRSIDRDSALRRLSDTELATLLTNEVWGKIRSDSPMSDIVLEAIERLRGERVEPIAPTPVEIIVPVLPCEVSNHEFGGEG